MVWKYCSVKNCYNSEEDKGRTFFIFPSYAESKRILAQKWVDFCGDPQLTVRKRKNYRKYICDIHFDEKSFVTPLRTRLRKDSVPTLFGPNAELYYEKEASTPNISTVKKENDNMVVSLIASNTLHINSLEAPHNGLSKPSVDQSGSILNQEDIKLESVVKIEDSPDNFNYAHNFVCGSNHVVEIDLEKNVITQSDSKNFTNIPSPVMGLSKSDLTSSSVHCSQQSHPTFDIQVVTDNSKLLNEHQDLVECNKSSQPMLGLHANRDNNRNKHQDVFPQVYTKDLHFCGECQKLFDSFDKYLVHKLKDEDYKMSFSESHRIPGLWLPRLSKKTAADSESEDSDTEESQNGWVASDHAKSELMCKFCGLFFETVVALKIHQDYVHMDKPYTCSECPEKFKNKGHMVRHYFRTHQKMT
ncbi:zinc finger protein 605-like [Homalodisca vitripennis]|uniref:zinc finger protein 605-like n=1 Tax=Homalodisca vitripennis TaxID=197043 RepID=UPI001EECBBF6|nr:zinc finger protein 605-like [Homalodisca vitripennis]